MGKAKFEIAYVDPDKKQLVELRDTDIDAELIKLSTAVQRILDKLETIGHYDLTTFTAHVGFELGYLVFKADGFIEITWTRKQSRG